MSTDGQEFSMKHQEAAISAYASHHNFSIVRTYADPGRSGVGIKHRHGLKQLLQDVIGGSAGYKAILVYDVSRWGRFQNPDEAAHYEYLCESAGTPVHYCGEQFRNDGTIPSSIMKALKRTMAAEYSRELSAKVYQGQKHLAQMGFRVGGKDLYGLRRVAVTSGGRRRDVLERGERKSVATDRIILVPGPKKEVECIRRIFQAAAYEGKSPGQIAKLLNRANVKFALGHEWDKDAVWRVLRSPQYAGYNVWNRTTQKIRSKKKFNPRCEWVLKAGAFVPLVDSRTFDRAQKMLARRRTWPARSDEEVIGQLRRLLARKGELSHKIMKAARGLYEPRTYYSRYGSYLKLYELVGYEVPKERLRSYKRAMNARLLRANVLDDLRRNFADHVRVLRPRRNSREIIQLDGHLPVSIFLCRKYSTASGLTRWLLKMPQRERQNVALICQADLDSGQVSDYFVIPPAGETVNKQKRLAANDAWLARGVKLGDLADFYGAALECGRVSG
jgi:DNA invertase Pin-like site-specific DNA recombinase